MNSPIRNRARVTLVEQSVHAGRGFEETYWAIWYDGRLVQFSKLRGETISSPLGPVRILGEDDGAQGDEFERIPPGHQFRNAAIVEAPVGTVIRKSRYFPVEVTDTLGFRELVYKWDHVECEIVGNDRVLPREQAERRRRSLERVRARVAPRHGPALPPRESAKRAAALAALLGSAASQVK